ncbi:MAG TPA: DUF881 domain-containing protein [Propionicimonas sp.]|mgnify:CR=1 FL=1|jgi:uncharacterized protein YlxW (UPF0749 family)|nr:DUF881 domain-containing protein [Propionicimonas sp.]
MLATPTGSVEEAGMARRWRRALVRVRRARLRRLAGPDRGRLLTFGVLAVAGLMVTVGALTARGGDLRPSANTDLVDLLNAESRRNAELAERAATLQAEVDSLASRLGQVPEAEGAGELEQAAGAVAVIGPGVTVTLDDAPLSVKPAGVDAELLVVHQQDIQAVVDALWSGGAEAMTVQGQRVTARTGIKCVGNTVVLHGVPYAPPYVVTAIGDAQALQAALEGSDYLRNYRDYARAYRLGYAEAVEAEVTLPASRAQGELKYARPA